MGDRPAEFHLHHLLVVIHLHVGVDKVSVEQTVGEIMVVVF